MIVGSDVADDLRGGDSRDILTGGKGEDILSGGRYGDVFVFADGFGHDTITDFGDRPSDQDVIKLVGYGSVSAAGFDAWKAEHVSKDATSGNVVITLGQDTVTLADVKDLGKIGFDDFLFA